MKRQQRIFDNEHVSFLHRRFQEHAFESLKQLQKLTMDFAQSSGVEPWSRLWAQNLPTVAYHNTMIQQDMARSLLELHPSLEEYAEAAYQLYARHTYGRDINGNVNVLQVTFPPFYEFFHTFLTWLCKHPAVSRLEIFSNFEVLDAASRAALCDALCVVLKNRVAIRQTLTKKQYDEQYSGGASRSRSRSKSPAPPKHHHRAPSSAASTTSSAFSKSVRQYEEEDDDDDSYDAGRRRRGDRSPSTAVSPSSSPRRLLKPLATRPSSDYKDTRSAVSSMSKPSMASSVVHDHWVKNLRQSSSMIGPPRKRMEVLPSESASQLMSTGKLFQKDRRSASGSEGTAPAAAIPPIPEARQVTVVAAQSASASSKKSKPAAKPRRSSDDDDDDDSKGGRSGSDNERSDDDGGF